MAASLEDLYEEETDLDMAVDLAITEIDEGAVLPGDSEVWDLERKLEKVRKKILKKLKKEVKHYEALLKQ